MTDDPCELCIERVSRQYDAPRGATVLKGVSLRAAGGESIAIVGPSGSGKSTLLNIIGSLDRPTSGVVKSGETIVTALEGPALARYRARGVGFIFQDHLLLPQLTALENVLLPTLAIDERDDGAHAKQLLDRVGLQGRENAFPWQLSGGERQRVAVARAMVNSPRLLLCDEPTGNLDRDTGVRVVELLLELARQDGAIVLLVTHNLELCRLCNRTVELRDGLLVEHGAEHP